MAKPNPIPEFRFLGFTEPWEEKRLEELLSTHSFGNYLKTPTTNGAYPVIQQGDVPVAGFSDGRPFSQFNEVVLFGDHTLSLYRPTTPFFVATDGLRILSCQSMHRDFLFTLLEHVRPPTEGYKRYFSILQDHNVFFPSLSEQEKIGAFFARLDEDLARQETRLKHLKHMKVACLKKFFPQEGVSEPEFRFPGFTEPWKRVRLGECFDERCECSAVGELISVTINEGIKRFSELGRYDNSSEDKSKYKRVRPGDIAYNTMRMWQGASGYSPYSGIMSPAYTILTPRENQSSLFFAYLFKRPDMIAIFKQRSQGITSDTWQLKYETLAEIVTEAPSLAEQEKIGMFFARLDELISVQTAKVERLGRVKSALLKKFFV